MTSAIGCYRDKDSSRIETFGAMAFQGTQMGSGVLSGQHFARQAAFIAPGRQCGRRQSPFVITARAGLPSIGMMGTKAGMTQIFNEGLAIPASVIAFDSGNIVTQVPSESLLGLKLDHLSLYCIAQPPIACCRACTTSFASASLASHTPWKGS